MITDALLTLSDAQANITTAATRVSTNTIDLGSVRDIGAGEPLFMAFQVDTAFASGTSLKMDIIVSAAANLGSPTVVASTPVILTAALVAGYQITLPIPALPAGSEKRYLGVQYTSVGTFDAGAISARIVKDAMPAPKNYASGYEVQT